LWFKNDSLYLLLAAFPFNELPAMTAWWARHLEHCQVSAGRKDRGGRWQERWKMLSQPSQRRRGSWAQKDEDQLV